MDKKDIFGALKADHDRHRVILDKLEQTQGASEERAELFGGFRVEVTAHAAAEEESLYATMLGKSDLREEAQHSVSEHKEIDDFLEELQEIDQSSSAWLKKFKEMKHRYLHHIEEEEEEMFVSASEGLSNAEEKRLADVFAKRKPAELRKAAAE